MQYRRFGKLDWQVSALGFGTLRLPLRDSNPAHVDEPEVIRMMRYAIDHGVNYVDTGYLYHDGSAEIAVGKALRNGYRDRVKLTTKIPPTIVHSATDFDRIFDEQLERLQTDFIDFYLLHAINRHYWHILRDLGIIPWLEKQMANRRIGHIGFSIHDEFDALQEIIAGYDNWTICQIQYNYVDTHYQVGQRGLKYAAGRGLAVNVMEPLRGGSLAKEPPSQIARIWADAPQKRSLAEWGLLWVLNHSEVATVLSGMSSLAQVQENVAIAERSGINILTEEELHLISRVQKAYLKLNPIPCTGCRYCMPCPHGVEIPHIFSLYNDILMYDAMRARFQYSIGDLKDGQRADNCQQCGECLNKCPQKFNVPEWLKKAHSLLGSDREKMLKMYVLDK
jgi:predicted aldo/keto reductase-like oxidoreductase